MTDISPLLEWERTDRERREKGNNGFDVYILYVVGAIFMIAIIIWLVLLIYLRQPNNEFVDRIRRFVYREGSKSKKLEYENPRKRGQDSTTSFHSDNSETSFTSNDS